MNKLPNDNSLSEIFDKYNAKQIKNIDNEIERTLKIDELRKQIRIDITHTIRKMRRETIKDKVSRIIDRINDNRHNIFKVLKKKSKNPGITHIREKDKLITDPQEVRNQTAKFWENLFENTDVTRFLWPIGHYFLHDKKGLITFKHKLFTGLPTRNVMKTRQKNRTDPNNDELKFRNTFCTWCGNGILENTEHICKTIYC